MKKLSSRYRTLKRGREGGASSLGASCAGENISNKPIALMGMGAAIGGTAEALGGGKFANGAVTGAFVALFNHAMHQSQSTSTTDSNPTR